MRQLCQCFWADDAGALIAIEYLFLAVILVMGILIGFASIRDSVNSEFAELANSYLALSTGYVISGQSACCAAVDGSQAIDTPSTVPDPLCTPPAIPSVVDTLPCN